MASAARLTFVYYVTGHGYGHATRVVEVTRHLIAAGHTVHVVTGAPHKIWTTEIASERLLFRTKLVDSGAIQSDALTVDRKQSLEVYEKLFERKEEIISEETRFLREVAADLVVVDIAPMACTAARRAGLRCVACTNFTWDYIYSEYVETQGNRFRVLCEEIANDYAKADLLLRLPGFTPMPAFRRVEDVPLVVRMAREPRAAIRARYGIAADAKVVIYNFGGQPSGWTLRENFLPPGWVCLVCTALAVPELPPNFIKPAADAYTPDLIDAADVMLGKVGYGTTSEAVAHDKPFVYIRRDFFNEQPFLVRLLAQHGLAHELRRDEFYAGKWATKLEQAFASAARGAPDASPTPRRADCRGGEVVAAVLEREARRADGSGDGDGDGDGDHAAPAKGSLAQKSHVVSGYLMRRPPRINGSSAVPSWTWSDSDGLAAGALQLPSTTACNAPRTTREARLPDAAVRDASSMDAAGAFAGFELVAGPAAYARAAGSAAAGGAGGAPLPDVLDFVAMLGALRSADAKRSAAGRAPDLVEAASSFCWPGGSGGGGSGGGSGGGGSGSGGSGGGGVGADDLFITRAPGRLDLMGGIADYSGSLVLQMPIREACVVAMQRQGRAAGGATLRIVSLGAEDNNRGPTFEMPLAELLRGGPDGGPLGYEQARARFASDPSTSWAAYVAGCLLVLAHEKTIDFGERGLSVLLRSAVPEGKGVSSSASIEVASMVGLTRCFAAEVRAACGGADIEPRELGLLAQMVENRVVGAPCGVMDQMASLLGQQDRLLALLCQPAEPLALVDIPSSLAVWGIDSGIRHAVSGADYGSVRVGAFMGYRLLERAWLQSRRAARRAEAEDEFEDECEAGEGLPALCGDTTAAETSEAEAGGASPGAPGARPLGLRRGSGRARRLGDGYLSNVSPSDFEGMATLPEAMAGADFLREFPEGTGDGVTSVDPGASYAVRQPTKHPVYEHFRVKSFAELLHGTPVAMGPFGRQVEMLGEMMYQSHASYSACGLGSEGTDRLVELVRRQGIKRGLYGAKITGGGSGGTVAVLGHVGSGEAIEEVAARYTRELGHKPHIFTGSSPGALAFGHLQLRPI